jgi:hypothetical protein
VHFRAACAGLFASLGVVAVGCGTRTGLPAIDFEPSDARASIPDDGGTMMADAGRSPEASDAPVPSGDAKPDVSMPCPAGLTALASTPHGQLGGAIAVDTTNVYWTAFSDGQDVVLRIPKCGGTVSTIISGVSGSTEQALAVDATNIYWLYQTSTYNAALLRIPKDGIPPTALAPGLSKGTNWTIAVNASSVYFENLSVGGGLIRAPLDGGAAATIAAVPGQSPSGFVAADLTRVYWTTGYGSGDLLRVGLEGGAPVTLASAECCGYGIALDETNVYWTAFTSGEPAQLGTVLKVPLDGGTPTTLASEKSFIPWAVAVDATSVYWTTYESVMKVPIGGGAAAKLGAIDHGRTGVMSGIAVDETSAYWTNPGTGVVVKLTPK